MARQTLGLALVLLCLVGLTALRYPAPREVLAGATPLTLRIDPNTADVHTLCLLPDIGPATAQHIIARRESVGPFRSADDLVAVKNISTKRLRALRPWVGFTNRSE